MDVSTQPRGVVQVGAQAASEAARFPQRAAVRLQEGLNRGGRASNLQPSGRTADRRHLWRGGKGRGEKEEGGRGGREQYEEERTEGQERAGKMGRVLKGDGRSKKKRKRRDGEENVNKGIEVGQ